MASITQRELNKHVDVAPLLAAWRKTRNERDRIELDGRSSPQSVRLAREAADAAYRAYSQACQRVQFG